MKEKRHIAAVMDLTWPYKRHYTLFGGILKYAEAHANWSFDLSNFPEVQLAEGGRFDGIIGRISGDCFAAAEAAGIPIVNVMYTSPVCSEVPGVHTDFHAAGRMAAKHLIARGLRRLVHIGYKGDRSSERHYRGMREVAAESGCACSRLRISVHYDEDRDQWLRFVDSFRKAQRGWRAPIGAGCVADEVSRSIASICANFGWEIPERMALVGCGNHEIICDSIEPTLSSIEMGDHQCGYEAARLLDRQMNKEVLSSSLHFISPKELVVRRSSDVFAVDDPKVSQALRFMSEHCKDSLLVPVIARHVGLGRQTLERRFRLSIGRSVNSELIRLRVETLKRLLVQSEEPVKALAAEAGFGTAVNMHATFKRHTGLTPSAYRKMHQPNYH